MKTPLIAAASLTLALALPLALPAAAQDKPTLTVLTYDSFVSDWGPGPAIEAKFEETCNCTLNMVGAGDGAALLARLKLEGTRTKADIVLGLDTNLTAAAAATGLFAQHGQSPDLDLPVEWQDDMFLPYDFGYFAFVYDKTKVATPPASFAELADSDLKIIIQDPRSSTPGLGLLLWIQHALGDKAATTWAGLNDNIITVTKGWSEAYGLFLEGEADMVLSYTTSPAYHLIAEDDDTKAAAAFSEGHYMQIEVAGKIASTQQSDLADEFLAFMTSEAFQEIIPTTNWMYPAKTPAAGLPAGFGTLITPDTALIYPANEAPEARAAALEIWLDTFNQ